MADRRSARTIRHDDDHEDEFADDELAGSGDDEFADRDAGLTAAQAVMATQDAVAGELLSVYQEAFTAALSPVRLRPNPDSSTLTASSAIVSGRVPVTSTKGATGPGWRRSSS